MLGSHDSSQENYKWDLEEIHAHTSYLFTRNCPPSLYFLLCSEANSQVAAMEKKAEMGGRERAMTTLDPWCHWAWLPPLPWLLFPSVALILPYLWGADPIPVYASQQFFFSVSLQTVYFSQNSSETPASSSLLLCHLHTESSHSSALLTCPQLSREAPPTFASTKNLTSSCKSPTDH